MEVFPPSGPGLGPGFHHCLLYISLGYGWTTLPVQLTFQRGQDVPDYFSSLLGPTRQQTRQPLQQVDTVIKVPDLLMGGIPQAS